MSATNSTSSTNPLNTSTTPLATADQVRQKIYELQQKLQTVAPGYEVLLQQIHKQLAADEGLVHMLNPEEVGVIVAGLSKHKGVVLIDAAAAKKATKSSLKSITEDDL